MEGIRRGRPGARHIVMIRAFREPIAFGMAVN
jgi:hypothetical protein